VVAATPALAAPDKTPGSDKPIGTDKAEVKAWADRTIEKDGWTYMGVVGRSAAPFALYMTEGPASPDVKRAIWLRNEYMVETNGYRSLQALLDIDCSLLKVRIKKSIAFKENNLKNKLSSDEQASAWQPAQPGSVLSGVVTDTCRSGPTTAALPAAPDVAVVTPAPLALAAGDHASEETTPRARPLTDPADPVAAAPIVTTSAAASTTSAIPAQTPGATPASSSAITPSTVPRTPPSSTLATVRAPSPATPPSPVPIVSAAAGPAHPALSVPNLIGRRRAAEAAAESPATTRPAPADGPRLQLGAYATRSIAEDAVLKLRTKEAALLKSRATQIQPFTNDQGTVFRLLLGPFADIAEAQSTCMALKARGLACFVRR
jgi:hypothetical protein